MPIWFIMVLTIGGAFALITAIRAFKNDGVEIAGQRIGRPTVVLAVTIIVTVFIFIAAIELGFIPDHAP